MELPEDLLKLTPREIQVMRLLADGKIAKQIAGQIGVSSRTVEDYIYKAKQKLGATCQAHAVAICFRSGIIA